MVQIHSDIQNNSSGADFLHGTPSFQDILGKSVVPVRNRLFDALEGPAGERVAENLLARLSRYSVESLFDRELIDGAIHTELFFSPLGLAPALIDPEEYQAGEVGELTERLRGHGKSSRAILDELITRSDE